MSSKAVNALFSKVETQKLAAVVAMLQKNGHPDLTKNQLIKHAVLEFVEQTLFQVQAAKLKRQEEIQAQAKQAMKEAQELKKERLQNGEAQSSVDTEGAVSPSASPEVPVPEASNETVMGDTGSGA